MKINNTVNSFLNSLPSVAAYHQQFPEVFHTYFHGYCKKTDERLLTASKQYEKDLAQIREVSELLPSVLKESALKCEDYFGFSIDISVHIFVGLYASNAFVDHYSAIYLAVEKLDPDPRLLEIIVTHEMIHSYHNQILTETGIDWLAINWRDVRNSFYREGIATYFSQKIVPGHHESVYYSYNEEGSEWLSFCREHFREIAVRLNKDLEESNSEIDVEWLRLSGGRHFGYNRLGYYLGTKFVEFLCKQRTEKEALELLSKNKAASTLDQWMKDIIAI